MVTEDHVVSLRPAAQVMRLRRLGCFHQSRLSFMRSLLRRLKKEKWQFKRTVWRINDDGTGVAVYSATGADYCYSLVAFAHNIPDEMRSDRVIATCWDATFCLYDGTPDEDDLARLARNVPKQEAGRISSKELSLSRANRSVRLWNYVVDCLSRGQQPDMDTISKVGYLMRTTAVYGSGKFGALDRQFILDRPLARCPFHLEMLSVYLTRCFTLDLVEHQAACLGGDEACKLKPSIRRFLGIGNSTGLGMAPFIINHPTLLHCWIHARETALSRVRSVARAGDDEKNIFMDLLKRAAFDADQWYSESAMQKDKITSLRDDFTKLDTYINDHGLAVDYPWDALFRWSASSLSDEGQEQLVSLLLEPYGDLVDPLTEAMHIDESKHFLINTDQTVRDLLGMIRRHYRWVWKYDFTRLDTNARFWYVSEEKLEPRIGERYRESGSDKELPFCIVQDVQNLHKVAKSYDGGVSLAAFLGSNSHHRHTVRRVQQTAAFPYAEIQDNLMASTMIPIDLLRCKLSFFGATKFDPRSDRWVRICMFQNAPFPDQLSDCKDDWVYPSSHDSTIAV